MTNICLVEGHWMSNSLGFAILSHTDLAQLERLVAALNRTYDRPPIAIHHDMSQSLVDVSKFPANVWFVEPSIPVTWSQFTLVDASLAALRILYDRASPEWFTMLSGMDYPVTPGKAVIEELSQSSVDVFMDYQLAERYPTPLPDDPANRQGTNTVEWRKMAYERYVTKTIRYPSLTKRLTRTHRQIVIRNGTLLSRLTPFSKKLKCYAGEFWITGNTKVAQLLLTSSSRYPELLKYYRGRLIPDESYWHTLLANQADIRIHRQSRRFTKWVKGENSPRVLELEDFPDIRRLGSHFARKFTSQKSAEVLAVIDQLI